MTVDQARSAWESMLADAHDSPAPDRGRRALRGPLVVVLRTSILLVIAALAILVLLPAVIAAQGARVG